MSFILRYVLPTLIVLVITLVAAELLTQNRPPPLRVQMVSLDPAVAAREQIALEEREGVLLWRPLPGRDNPDCGKDDPDALHVVVVGDSIPYGSGVATHETFAALLENQLSTDGQTICVHNHGVPGTGFIQQSLLALEAIERDSPDVLVWTLWSSTIKHYWVLGDAAYDLSQFNTDEEGFPETGLPASLNRTLFRHSALYRHAVLTFKNARYMKKAWENFAAEEFGPRLDRIQEAAPEMRMLFVNSTPLDTSFATQAHRRKKGEDAWDQYNRPFLHAELKQRGIALIQLDEAFGDAPVEDVRVDTCCHFNAEGMRLIADILRPHVKALLPTGDQP